MQGVKEYNQKILSLRNIKKITNSMKMISTVKIQRFMKMASSSIQWWNASNEILSQTISLIQKYYPLFVDGHPKCEKNLVIVCSADQGLCGRFNAHLISASSKLWQEILSRNEECSFYFLGGKARKYFVKRDVSIVKSYEKLQAKPFQTLTGDIVDEILAFFKSAHFHRIWIVRAKKMSSVLMMPVVESFLPLSREILEKSETFHDGTYQPLIEENRRNLSEAIVREFLCAHIHRSLIESALNEHGARMTAMDAAVSSCDRMSKHYVQLRDRARQSAITTELNEIVTGKEVIDS